MFSALKSGLHPGRWLEQLGRDLRFSARSLRRAWGLSLAVIATLTLCIGANGTIFSVLYGLILKPLPFQQPGQLVEIYNSFPKAGQAKRQMSVAQYLDYKANANLFDGFALWQGWTFNIGEKETDPTRGIGAQVTADYFKILGVQPLLGRFFTMEECVAGRDQVVVLTQSFWETNYHADPGIVGKTIRLSSMPFTVIGVAPRRIEEIDATATLLKPLTWDPRMAGPQARVNLSATMYGRVKAGVAPSVALAQLATLEQRYQHESAPAPIREFLDHAGYRIALGLVRAEQTKPVRTSLLLLQGGALLVLLLGCVNVASLLLARANGRQAELAIRQALGASRMALAAQMFIESLLLAAAAAPFGLALAWSSLGIINRYSAVVIRQAPAISLDGTILEVTVLATFAVALLIGLLPMLRLGPANLLGSMQGGSRGASAGGRMRAINAGLVVTQVALTLTLLVGAGLLISSFARVMGVATGYDAAHIVHARVALNVSYQNLDFAHATADRIVAKMREIPGVEAVGMTSHAPMYQQFPVGTFPIRGSQAGQQDTAPTATDIGVSPEFFAAMGIRVVAGRNFTAADNLPQARRVYVVDQSFVKKYFPDREAVGQILGGNPGAPASTWPTIVGVVEVARFDSADDLGVLPMAYTPIGSWQFNGFSMEIRSQRPLAELVPQMRAKLRSVDPELPLYQVTTVQTILDTELANRRGVMMLLLAFAMIALILSAVGIYGMLAYDVSQRTREIGIRGAIGASRGQIARLILGQGLSRAGIGIGIGLLGALVLTRFMTSLLYEVRPSDPAAYVVVSLLLFTVALVASYLPARRAARVDPVVALRAE